MINGVSGASRQLHGIVSVRCGTRHTTGHDHRGELPAHRDPPQSARARHRRSASPPPKPTPTASTDVLNITLTSTPAVPIGRLGRTHWSGGPSSLAGKFDFGRFAATRACVPLSPAPFSPPLPPLLPPDNFVFIGKSSLTRVKNYLYHVSSIEIEISIEISNATSENIAYIQGRPRGERDGAFATPSS